MTNQSKNNISRRALIKRTGGAAAGLGLVGLLTGCGGSSSGSSSTQPSRPDANDYLNFFLNLEYLESEYYLRGVTGVGLPTGLNGGTGAGKVTGGRQVQFTNPVYLQAFQQIAAQEEKHVEDLRSALFGGGAVPEPTINLTAGFANFGVVSGIGTNFDPFLNEDNFVIGAFLLENMMSSAYAGSVTKDVAVLAGILGNEAHHDSLLRLLIYQAGGTLLADGNLISTYCSKLNAGAGVPITTGGVPNFFPTNANGQEVTRSPQQILDIVYGNTFSVAGGFFPNALNGYIK